jgi:disulfide bond formation protein DsbB
LGFTVINWFFGAPRRAYAIVCLACLLGLAFAVYLQLAGGLNPCPMCIVQRYALILVAIFSALAGFANRRGWQLPWAVLALLTAVGGAYTAAKQSFLQWYPPEVVSCGRDFYGMVESFPLQRAIPMIFRGSGDCTAVDWTFLGGSIANWAFVVFVVLALVLVGLLVRRPAKRIGFVHGGSAAYKRS